MRRLLIFCLLILSAAVTLATVPEGFATTWADVQRSAQQRNVLIYLHFTDTWFKWCRKIEAETYTDALVKQELAKNFATASLDTTVALGQSPTGEVAKNIDLFHKYGEPASLSGDSSADGSIIYQKISVYLPVKDFLQKLTDAKKTEQDYLAFQQYASTADKTSYEYTLRALRMMARVSRRSEALAMAKRLRELDPDNKKGDAPEAAWIALQSIPIQQWTTDGKDYLRAISTFDANNVKGFLEKSKMEQATITFRQQHYLQCAAYLESLIASAKTLQNEQQVYGMLGISYHESGNLENAISTLELAIKADPTSNLGRWLQQHLDKYKSEKK